MKVSIIGTIGRKKNLPLGFAFDGSSGQQMSAPVQLRLAYPSRIRDRAEADSLRRCRLWVFRNKVVRVEDAAGATRAEIITRVKHRALSEEKSFAKVARVVELFEKMERSPSGRRFPIPDEVRVLVWRRDGGKCVMCGSQERLEFDHISRVQKGGSSTAQNIQLLCERCNRQKGATI